MADRITALNYSISQRASINGLFGRARLQTLALLKAIHVCFNWVQISNADIKRTHLSLL